MSTYFAEQGWGAFAFDFAAANEGVIVVQLDRSALAESAPRARRDAGPRGDLACHLVAGSLGGILSALAGRRLVAREVACVSAGAPRCSVVVVAQERRDVVDASLQRGVRGVDPMRAALRRAPRAGSSTA